MPELTNLFTGDINQLHFIRPMLLLGLPVVMLLFFLVKRAVNNSGWESYLPKETIRVLRVNGHNGSGWLPWYFLVAAMLLCVAAAGPTWVKQPVPTVQNQRALVVVLDLSPSMLAQDLKPDRLTRAKYKLIDILREYQDGQVALIAYAGDAHTVSPLTDDPKTLEALLPALHPAIMPSPGSNTESAIALAQQLLRDAQLSSGDILLITDGVAPSALTSISNDIESGITVSVMGVGSSQATPIPSVNGGFLRGRDGEIVLSQVNETQLKQFAARLGGRYARLNISEQDINYLIRDDFQADTSAAQVLSVNSFDSWADMGHWFLLLVLPLAVWCFRRGFIYCLPVFFLLPEEQTWADESPQAQVTADSALGFSWKQLWQTPDQRGKTLLEQEQYANAAKTFEREDWRAIANYKNGDFAAAAQQLESAKDFTSVYNKGNALAMSGNLEQALEAFEQVLSEQPEHADAQHNKAVIEKLIEQKKQQDQQQNDQSGGDDQQQGGQQQDQKQDQKQQDQQQQQDNKESEESSPQESDQSDSSKQQNESQSEQSPESDESDNTESQDQSDANPDESAEQDSNEQEREDESQAAQTTQDTQPSDSEQVANEVAQDVVDESATSLKDSSEQWLRGIKDDPSGLLRRKFKYQADQKLRSAPQANSNEERY